ncbi:hypothetical protein [Anaerobacillus alkalidiazotrophicus]|uniref:hypothetical protein n=1 Tax=Anaerobacillus alkalidiazotrophicus TaxID=472963 RepID=UPI0014710518|nr:hypothetical protein [Anaerobacillus alkalidiazotrophicus]
MDIMIIYLENEYSGASLSEVSKSQSGDFSSRIYKLTAINSPIHQQTASQEKLEVN